MFELTIHSPDGRELKRYELTGRRPIRIGRGVDCAIQIASPQVSRRHAQLEPLDEETWVLKDLESTHGCKVRGERIREITVVPGLEVTIGPAVLKFDNLTARIGEELDELLGDEDDGAPAAGADAAAQTSPRDAGADSTSRRAPKGTSAQPGAPAPKSGGGALGGLRDMFRKKKD